MRGGKTIITLAELQRKQLEAFLRGKPPLRVWYGDHIDVEFRVVKEEEMLQPWKVGDLVRFANEPEGIRRRVTAVTTCVGQPMIEIEGMVGQFGAHIFVAHDYPADSIVPRKK